MGKTACLHAIRRFCLNCMGGSPQLVRQCLDHSCALHAWRMGQGAAEEELPPEFPPEQLQELPFRPVRRFCLHCAGSKRHVRECPASGRGGETACALWAYRLGLSSRGMERLRKRREKARELKLPGL